MRHYQFLIKHVQMFSGCQWKHSPSFLALPPTTDPQSRSSTSTIQQSKDSTGPVQKKDEHILPSKSKRLFDEQAKMQERLERLEREVTHRRVSSDQKSSSGRVKKPIKGWSRRAWWKLVHNIEREVLVESTQEIICSKWLLQSESQLMLQKMDCRLHLFSIL